MQRQASASDQEITRQRTATGREIARRRVLAGIKPGDFARRVGCHYSHLANIEAGRRGASPELVARIASELECDRDVFYAGAAQQA